MNLQLPKGLSVSVLNAKAARYGPSAFHNLNDFREGISEARHKHVGNVILLPKMPRPPQTRDIEVTIRAAPTGSVF